MTAPKGSHSVIAFGHDTSLAEGGEDELLPRDRGSKERPGAKKTPPQKENFIVLCSFRHERFVNFYKYYQNIFSTVWIFAIILPRMRGYSSPTLLALTVLTKGAKHYEVHIRL